MVSLSKIWLLLIAAMSMIWSRYFWKEWKIEKVALMKWIKTPAEVIPYWHFILSVRFRPKALSLPKNTEKSVSWIWPVVKGLNNQIPKEKWSSKQETSTSLCLHWERLSKVWLIEKAKRLIFPIEIRSLLCSLWTVWGNFFM